MKQTVYIDVLVLVNLLVNYLLLLLVRSFLHVQAGRGRLFLGALVVEKSVLLPVLPSCLKQNTAPENWSEGVRLIPYHAVSGPGFLPGRWPP